LIEPNVIMWFMTALPMVVHLVMEAGSTAGIPAASAAPKLADYPVNVMAPCPVTLPPEPVIAPGSVFALETIHDAIAAAMPLAARAPRGLQPPARAKAAPRTAPVPARGIVYGEMKTLVEATPAMPVGP
jgi:hypothetical protein